MQVVKNHHNGTIVVEKNENQRECFEEWGRFNGLINSNGPDLHGKTFGFLRVLIW
jgi:hypothetical protein